MSLKGLGEGETQIHRVTASAESHSHESACADALIHRSNAGCISYASPPTHTLNNPTYVYLNIPCSKVISYSVHQKMQARNRFLTKRFLTPNYLILQ